MCQDAVSVNCIVQLSVSVENETMTVVSPGNNDFNLSTTILDVGSSSYDARQLLLDFSVTNLLFYNALFSITLRFPDFKIAQTSAIASDLNISSKDSLITVKVVPTTSYSLRTGDMAAFNANKRGGVYKELISKAEVIQARVTISEIGQMWVRAYPQSDTCGAGEFPIAWGNAMMAEPAKYATGQLKWAATQAVIAEKGDIYWILNNPHFSSNGEIIRGFYSSYLPRKWANCVWPGNSIASASKAQIIITDGLEKQNVATSSVKIDSTYVIVKAAGFHYSSPVVVIRPIKTVTSITCKKGKTSVQISGNNPQCPKGYSKKS